MQLTETVEPPSSVFLFARTNDLTGLMMVLQNAAWSLGRCELIALNHNELLENTFV